MIRVDARPTLAPKVRLRWDRQASRYMLLYPERGLVLNATGADIVQLCTGEHTVGGIVEQLAGKYAREPADVAQGGPDIPHPAGRARAHPERR